MKTKLKLGDSVVVKQGVKEPDFEEFEIGGWQGRIIKIDTESDKNNVLITIEWDSFTLKQIPSNYISISERDGYDWQKMVLYDSELEKTKPRDKKRDTEQAQDKLAFEHHWDSFGDQGARIVKVLADVDQQDIMQCLQKWVEYLDKELSFPIAAIVAESADDRLIRYGDKVLIKKLSTINDLYGIIASIRLDGKHYEYPLCDLDVIDEQTTNFQLIDDYLTWFGNR